MVPYPEIVRDGVEELRRVLSKQPSALHTNEGTLGFVNACGCKLHGVFNMQRSRRLLFVIAYYYFWPSIGQLAN